MYIWYKLYRCLKIDNLKFFMQNYKTLPNGKTWYSKLSSYIFTPVRQNLNCDTWKSASLGMTNPGLFSIITIALGVVIFDFPPENCTTALFGLILQFIILLVFFISRGHMCWYSWPWISISPTENCGPLLPISETATL